MRQFIWYVGLLLFELLELELFDEFRCPAVCFITSFPFLPQSFFLFLAALFSHSLMNGSPF